MDQTFKEYTAQGHNEIYSMVNKTHYKSKFTFSFDPPSQV